MSVYHVGVGLAGDASGGNSNITIQLDPNFLSLVASMNLTLDFTAVQGDQEFQFQIQEDANSKMYAAGVAKENTSWGFTTNIASWAPAGFLVARGNNSTMPFIRSLAHNQGVGDTHYLYAHIYNFARNARDVVPIEFMKRVLTRAESLTGT